MSARDDLDRALVEMASRGERPPCGGADVAHLFTSEDHDERARAVDLCVGCPVLEACGAAADDERDTWTVRGGVDRRPSPTARRARRETAS